MKMETFENYNRGGSKDNYTLILEKRIEEVNKILNSKAFKDLCSHSDYEGYELALIETATQSLKELNDYYHGKIACHKGCKVLGD